MGWGRTSRLWIVGLALAAALPPVSSCRREPPAEAPPSLQIVGLAVETGSPTWWTNRARRGLERSAKVLGAEPVDLGDVTPTDARDAVRALGERGAVVAFLIGEDWAPLVYTESVGFPGTRYVVVGSDGVGEHAVGVTFLPEEAAFLAGVLAATVTNSGPCAILGSGGDQPAEAIEGSFAAGFAKVHRGAETLRMADPAELASAAAAGVRVVLVVGRSPDPAVLEAAVAAGVGLVVTDPTLVEDRAPGVVAAITVDLDEAMERVAREADDRSRTSYVFDLSSGVVDLVVSDRFIVRGGGPLIEALAVARAEITAGITEVEHLGF